LEWLVYGATLLIGLFALNEISYSSKKKMKERKKEKDYTGKAIEILTSFSKNLTLAYH
jgi:hypothetical protein